MIDASQCTSELSGFGVRWLAASCNVECGVECGVESDVGTTPGAERGSSVVEWGTTGL